LNLLLSGKTSLIKITQAKQPYHSSSSSRQQKWFHVGQEFHKKFNSLWWLTYFNYFNFAEEQNIAIPQEEVLQLIRIVL
jgi:hypothetical protein